MWHVDRLTKGGRYSSYYRGLKGGPRPQGYIGTSPIHKSDAGSTCATSGSIEAGYRNTYMLSLHCEDHPQWSHWGPQLRIPITGDRPAAASITVSSQGQHSHCRQCCTTPQAGMRTLVHDSKNLRVEAISRTSLEKETRVDTRKRGRSARAAQPPTTGQTALDRPNATPTLLGVMPPSKTQ
jgi:hypothetical protein